MTDSGASTCQRTRRSVSTSTVVSYISARVLRSSCRTGSVRAPTLPRWRRIEDTNRRRMSACPSVSEATLSRLRTMRESGVPDDPPANGLSSGGSRSLTGTP